MSLSQLAQPGCRQIKGFAPANALPPGIRIAFRPCSLEGIEQPIRVIDEFRRGSSLSAECLAGGVVWEWFEGNETAVFDHSN
jgi:hypothetical protein